MNTDFTFYLTICGLLVLLLALLGARIEMQCSRNIEPTPKSDSSPGSPSFDWGRFVVVVCVTLLAALLTGRTVALWSAVMAGQRDRLLPALPISLLWVGSLLRLFSLFRSRAGLRTD